MRILKALHKCFSDFALGSQTHGKKRKWAKTRVQFECHLRFFGATVDILTQSVPQLVFLGSIFIYLCLQIILKWINFWVRPATIFDQFYPGSHCAPSLLIGLINMAMLKERSIGFVDADGNTRNHCHLVYWYEHQVSSKLEERQRGYEPLVSWPRRKSTLIYGARLHPEYALWQAALAPHKAFTTCSRRDNAKKKCCESANGLIARVCRLFRVCESSFLVKRAQRCSPKAARRRHGRCFDAKAVECSAKSRRRSFIAPARRRKIGAT